MAAEDVDSFSDGDDRGRGRKAPRTERRTRRDSGGRAGFHRRRLGGDTGSGTERGSTESLHRRRRRVRYACGGVRDRAP